MNVLWTAVLALGSAGAAWGADDDDLPRALTDKEREARLLELEARVRGLEGRSGGPAAPQDPAAKEKAQEPVGSPVEKQKASGDPSWDAGKMLTFVSADGNFTAKVGGRIFLVGVHRFGLDDQYGTGGETAGDLRRDNFVVDTARVQLDGTFFKDFVYRMEYAAEKNTAAVSNDAWIAWTGVKDYFTLTGGQFKVPFSQEETTSSRFIDFAERSLVNRLVPGRDQGVMLSGAFADKVFEWALGAFNGTGKNLPDTNDEFDLAARLLVTPLKNAGPVLKDLRVGADATVGDQDGDVAPADVTAGDVFPDTIIDFNGAALADGLRTRWTLNVSWLYGPASLRAEYMVVEQELNDAAPQGEFEIAAWYVQATWLLSGETKPLENRVKPHANFHPLQGTWGAFELAARVSHLDASDGEDAGLINTGVNAEARQLTIGLNWWWAPNVAWRFNYERFSFDEDLPGLKTGNEADDELDAFYVRWQIDF